MRIGPLRDLDQFAWRHPQLPRHTVVAVCPAEAAEHLGLARLSPADATGATGLVLSLAAEALSVPADRIVLHRPGSVTAGPGTPKLFASLARTVGCIAAAVSRVPVGVDVEQLQTEEEARELSSLFHPDDRAAAYASDAGLGPATTMIWTRIEAELKLRGTGLRRDPAAVRVGPGPEPLRFRRVQTLSNRCCQGSQSAASETETSVSVAWRRTCRFGLRL